MILKKGTKLIVIHKSLGRFNGKVAEDFDTVNSNFYPIQLEDETLYSFSKKFKLAFKS